MYTKKIGNLDDISKFLDTYFFIQLTHINHKNKPIRK